MFVEDLRNDFYLQLLGKKILVLAEFDLDSLCACKILQRLFRDDGVEYVIKPVNGIKDMHQTYLKCSNSFDVVIMVNCGITLDLQESLGNPVKPIYVIDSHRPVHVLNVYEESKYIRVVVPRDENITVPAIEKLFREDYFDPEEEDDDGEIEDHPYDAAAPCKKRKINPKSVEEKQEMKEWEAQRFEAIYQYTKFPSYGTPTALTVLELDSWTLPKDQKDIIWWAAVSLTESFLLEKIPQHNYQRFVTKLQEYIDRASHSQDTPMGLKILFEYELSFLLYRHWNLYDSIKMTPYCSARFRFWCFNGEQRYHQFLADAGLPLSQVKQQFPTMDLHLRRNLKEILSTTRVRSKYNIEDITFGTFTAQIGYQNKYNALDTVFGALATLESTETEISPSDKFMSALEFLTIGNAEKAEIGLNRAKELITAVHKEVQSICGFNQLLVFGPFMYVQVQPSLDLKYYSQPNAAKFLVHFVTRVVVANRKDRQQLHKLPMVLLIPQDEEWYLVIGIPPLAAETTKSTLGRAFEQVHKKMKDFSLMDNFDPCVMKVQASRKQLFLDILLVLLTF